MPSCHRGMEILHATRRSDGADVVVKVRSKAEARRNRKSSWLPGAEFLLNLQPSANIAQVDAVMEDPEAYYVVMEKVPGKDLFETVVGKVMLPVDEIKDILSQILVALGELHAEGQIHRDVKLENVMLDKTPTSTDSTSVGGSLMSPTSSLRSPMSVKLIDFDTVQAYEASAPALARDVLGTNQYIAQEAYEGQYSPASDVFAAGVIGYRLLTGKFPFRGEIFDDKPGENRVGSLKMQEIRSRLCGYEIKWSFPVFQEEPDACDLLRRMLAASAADRPSARTALAHPWFGGGGAGGGDAAAPATLARRSRGRAATDGATAAARSLLGWRGRVSS